MVFHVCPLLRGPKLDKVCRCGPVSLFLQLIVLLTLCLLRSTLALSLLSTRVLQFFSAEMFLSSHSWHIWQCVTSPVLPHFFFPSYAELSFITSCNVSKESFSNLKLTAQINPCFFFLFKVSYAFLCCCRPQ